MYGLKGQKTGVKGHWVNANGLLNSGDPIAIGFCGLHTLPRQKFLILQSGWSLMGDPARKEGKKLE
jgi:hypothetical protein